MIIAQRGLPNLTGLARVCQLLFVIHSTAKLVRTLTSLSRTDISVPHRHTKKEFSGAKILAFGTKIGGNWWKQLGEIGRNSQKQQQQPKTAKNYNNTP